jgi:hypothetical protein
LARSDDSRAYRSPMENGMPHFHEWYRRKMDAPGVSTSTGAA